MPELAGTSSDKPGDPAEFRPRPLGELPDHLVWGAPASGTFGLAGSQAHWLLARSLARLVARDVHPLQSVATLGPEHATDGVLTKSGQLGPAPPTLSIACDV